MLFRVFGTHDAAFHKSAHVRMIASQAQNARAAHQVKAAVANVRKIELAAPQNQGCAGGAHAVEGGMMLCIILNASVRGSKRLDQSSPGIVADGTIIDFANGFNRHAAGFLAALVSSHAVGNYRESSLALEFFVAGRLPIEVGVFIVFALAAYVAKAGHLHSGFHIHAINRHFFTTSPSARERSGWHVERLLLPEGPMPRYAPAIIDRSDRKSAILDPKFGKCDSPNQRVRRTRGSESHPGTGTVRLISRNSGFSFQQIAEECHLSCSRQPDGRLDGEQAGV